MSTDCHGNKSFLTYPVIVAITPVFADQGIHLGTFKVAFLARSASGIRRKNRFECKLEILVTLSLRLRLHIKRMILFRFDCQQARKTSNKTFFHSCNQSLVCESFYKTQFSFCQIAFLYGLVSLP